MAKEAKKSAVLPTTLEEALEVIESQNSVIAELNESNTKLSDELALTKKAGEATGALSVVKHDGKSYQFTSKAFFLNVEGEVKKYTHEEAASNKELVAKLVEMKSAHLKQL